MTIKMIRSEDEFPAPHTADVHKDEVENFAAAGWTVASEQAAPAGPVEIPDDWASQHHATRIKLAKAIKGDDDVADATAANAIIEAEVERRAEAAGA